MGLFESFGVIGAAGAPALAAAETYFDAQPAAMLRAALAGDAARVRDLLGTGVDPNSHGPRSADKNTPQITLLGYALGQRNEAALRVLIQAGASPLFEARADDGNAFLFAIVRKDSAMLDALYRAWPIAKIPANSQSRDAFSALGFKCNECLQVMFKNGLSVGVQDELGYNLLMEALSREDFKTAEWLLKDVGVPLDAESNRGITPANQLQAQIARYKPDTPVLESLLRLKALMQTRGVAFPVETAEQRRSSRGIK